MTTVYRFPDQLGGGEYEAVSDDHAGHPQFDIPGVGRIEVPLAALVEVEPVLPPEPPVWSTVGVLQSSGHYLILQCQPTLGPDSWFISGDVHCERHTWERVCSFGTPTLLVPDPFAEPVTLPWTTNVGQTFVEVDGNQREGVALQLDWRGLLPAQIAADLSPTLAEDVARALWAAAQRARGAADAAEAQR